VLFSAADALLHPNRVQVATVSLGHFENKNILFYFDLFLEKKSFEIGLGVAAHQLLKTFFSPKRYHYSTSKCMSSMTSVSPTISIVAPIHLSFFLSVFIHISFDYFFHL
jgi:hypothetical protein